MVSPLIAKIGLPVLLNLIGEALGKVENPVTQKASKAIESVNTALSVGAISHEQLAEVNRHVEAMAALQYKENENILSDINETLRAESSSDDIYVRRMRPTFGYLMAFTWAVQMVSLAYIVVFETGRAAEVLKSMESLSTMWAVGLSVLGIYVYKRSEEKKIQLKGEDTRAAGEAPSFLSKGVDAIRTLSPSSPRVNP